MTTPFSPFAETVLNHLWDLAYSSTRPGTMRRRQAKFPPAYEPPIFTQRATGGWITNGGKLFNSHYRFVVLDESTDFRVSANGRVWFAGRTCPSDSPVDFEKIVFVHDRVMLFSSSGESVLRPLDEQGNEMVVMHGGPAPETERRDVEGYERNWIEDLRWATQEEFAEYLASERAAARVSAVPPLSERPKRAVKGRKRN